MSKLSTENQIPYRPLALIINQPKQLSWAIGNQTGKDLTSLIGQLNNQDELPTMLSLTIMLDIVPPQKP